MDYFLVSKIETFRSFTLGSPGVDSLDPDYKAKLSLMNLLYPLKLIINRYLVQSFNKAHIC